VEGAFEVIGLVSRLFAVSSRHQVGYQSDPWTHYEL
jgi:hypothetical protein